MYAVNEVFWVGRACCFSSQNAFSGYPRQTPKTIKLNGTIRSEENKQALHSLSNDSNSYFSSFLLKYSI